MSKFSELRGLIEKSLDANPESWRSFFQKYKCDAQSAHPEQEIVKAFANYGEPVVVDVNSMLADSYSGWLGESSTDILASVKDTSDLLTSWMQDSLYPTPTGIKMSEEELERKSRNTWLIIFIVVIVICCVTFFVVKRMKK